MDGVFNELTAYYPPFISRVRMYLVSFLSLLVAVTMKVVVVGIVEKTKEVLWLVVVEGNSQTGKTQGRVIQGMASDWSLLVPNMSLPCVELGRTYEYVRYRCFHVSPAFAMQRETCSCKRTKSSQVLNPRADTFSATPRTAGRKEPLDGFVFSEGVARETFGDCKMSAQSVGFKPMNVQLGR